MNDPLRSMNTVHSGRIFFDDAKHPAFELLKYTKPSLCLDIGAAAGIFSKLIRARSPVSRVYAYEPFIGNHPFFERNIGIDPKVTLHKVAVSNSSGMVSFYVPSTVKGSEPGWNDYAGYSSLGHVVDDLSSKQTMNVNSIALDDVIVERVGFCKIDIQGGEFNALVGAKRLMRAGLIDMILLEFGGEIAILNLLFEMGFIVVDTKFLLVCSRGIPIHDDWLSLDPVSLSTGVEAYQAWPVNLPCTAQLYCEWIQSRSRLMGGVWTDLLCIHKTYLPIFLRAVATLAEDNTNPIK